MLTFTQTNVNAKPFFLLGADVPKSCPKIRRYDSAFSSNIFRCWNRCVGFFTYLDLIKIGALGGGSQNFLGKFVRFFVTLSYFYGDIIHRK